MASTEAARLLTQAYIRRQLAIKAATTSDLLRLWRLFRLDDLDGSWQTLEPAVLAVITQRSGASAGLASSYFRAFRTAEGVRGVPEPRIALPAPRQSVIAGLRILGPIATKKSITAGAPDPMGLAFTRVSGTATRQVLNAGRQTIVESVKADREALGWARATSGRACSFCAMLASRGPVYKGEGSAGFRAHNHCACSVEPVYSRDAPWPDGSTGYKATWDQAKAQAADDHIDPALAFRRLLEGR